MNCLPCDEEAGIIKPAVDIDEELGPVCENCCIELAVSRSAERLYAAQYSYAAGYQN